MVLQSLRQPQYTVARPRKGRDSYYDDGSNNSDRGGFIYMGRYQKVLIFFLAPCSSRGQTARQALLHRSVSAKWPPTHAN